MNEVSVVWFRRDLRLRDNEAVAKAAHAQHCLFVYVIDPWFFSQPEIGWLRVKFLFESLAALDNDLHAYGQELLLLKGDSVSSLQGLLQTLQTHHYKPTLYFNQDIQVAYGRTRDEAVQAHCHTTAVPLHETQNYFLLYDESRMNQWWRDYYNYQYSPAYDIPDIRPLAPTLRQLVLTLAHINPQRTAETLHTRLPTARQPLFKGGEQAARSAIYLFLKDRIDGYRWKISRPYLAQYGATSLLGPHLAFGTISNRTIFQTAVNHLAKIETKLPKKAFDIATYLDRLRWRDSFTQRLWFHPELMWQNRFTEFDVVYQDTALSGQQLEYFERWKTGTTGFPLLDAAMKQLANDGFINFRMRAMAATFLTINCGVSWHHGARHFMNCLVDGDIAINHWQWQMQAGITNPLSPTFRIYSPTKNFYDRDPQADYVHFWLPKTRGKSVETIITESEPMLDFLATRKTNGKIVSELRQQTCSRILSEKGNELANAETARRTVINYGKYSADRYKRYMK